MEVDNRTGVLLHMEISEINIIQQVYQFILLRKLPENIDFENRANRYLSQ